MQKPFKIEDSRWQYLVGQWILGKKSLQSKGVLDRTSFLEWRVLGRSSSLKDGILARII